MDPGGAGAADDDGDRPSLERLVDAVKERRDRAAASDGEAEAAGRDGTTSMPPEVSEFGTGQDAGDEGTGFGSDPKTEAIIELIGDASNLLLLGPLLSQPDYDLCSRLTTAFPRDPDNLLLVTMTESPDERLGVLSGYMGEFPERTVMLSVGDSTRSAATETVSTGEGGTVTIETIPDPGDLMRIGITISKRLSEWEEAGGRTAVCFHSLTALLQYAEDPHVAFRFVHTLLGRLKSTGARGHFHMDEDAHERQLVATFRPIFDEVLTFDEDGRTTVDH